MMLISRNFIILIGMMLLLTGCGESVKIQQKAQADFDKYNLNRDKGYCLVLGVNNIIYPYTTTNNPPPIPNGLQVAFNDELNNRLQVFSQVGLLLQEVAGQEEEQPIYRYNLTTLGQQYFYSFARNDAFCFGRVIIDDVDVDSANDDNWGRSTKWFHFKFHLENVPQWVSNNYDLLSPIYRFDVKDEVDNGYQPMAGQLIDTPQGWALDASFSRILRGSY